MNNEILKNYREQIDTLDKELLYLFSRRFTIVNEIWNIKKQEGIKPLQTTRWEKLLSEKQEIGQELWLKEMFINDIWNRIHKESLDIEQ